MSFKFHDISPTQLATIDDFDWMVRTLALGERMGNKKSRKTGAGMEFNQYRPYSQGDDLRQLDWKMYARSDKFYIKQSEVDTTISVTFILDQSASMQYSEGDWSKFEAGKLLIAVMAYLARSHGDHIGLADSLGNPSGDSERHWLRFLQRLRELSASGVGGQPRIENKRGKELFVVITDLYDQQLDWQTYISSLKSPRNEVIVLHWMGEQEEQLGWQETTLFEDLETGEALEVSPSLMRDGYKAALSTWKENLEQHFLKSGIDYQPMHFTRPVDEVVKAFLQKRKRLL